MTGPATVRRIEDRDTVAFRELRLEGLRHDPLAFGSTEAREREYPDERWASWAHRGAVATREATFVAEGPTGDLVGMIGAFEKEGCPQLWGMWVRPTHRRKGIGGQLLVAVLAWTRSAFPGAAPGLEVNPDLADAVRLYRAHGFVFTGSEEPLGHHAPAVVREMRRPATKLP